MKKRDKQFLAALEDAVECHSDSNGMNAITELFYQEGDLAGETFCNIVLFIDVYDLSTIEKASTDRGDMPVGCTNVEYDVRIGIMPEEFLHLREQAVEVIIARLEQIYE